MSIRQLLVTGVALVLGLGIGQGLSILSAQEEAQGPSREAPQGWEIHHGQMADQSDNAFYVIKHNRVTGETLVLSVIGTADDDEWYRLPVETLGSNK